MPFLESWFPPFSESAASPEPSAASSEPSAAAVSDASSSVFFASSSSFAAASSSSALAASSFALAAASAASSSALAIASALSFSFYLFTYLTSMVILVLSPYFVPLASSNSTSKEYFCEFFLNYFKSTDNLNSSLAVYSAKIALFGLSNFIIILSPSLSVALGDTYY